MKERSARVRVIDRDPEFAGSVAALLRDAGHRVSPRTGAQLTTYDLLVIGLPAPGNVSPSLDEGVPVLLLLGSPRYGELEAWTRSRPGYGLLAKPVSPAALLEAVDLLLAPEDGPRGAVGQHAWPRTARRPAPGG